jgi:hypothetical protein
MRKHKTFLTIVFFMAISSSGIISFSWLEMPLPYSFFFQIEEPPSLGRNDYIDTLSHSLSIYEGR